jgi:ABC-type tungstate transport system permease subunit
MARNKQLLILGDKISMNQKYMQKVNWKRSTKLIFLNFSSRKWNILCNFKVKCHRPLFMCVEVSNVCPPIVVV